MTPDDFIQIIKKKIDKCYNSKNNVNVIAGIVLVDTLVKTSKCIVFSTGTKSTPLELITNDGCILNDCHAEVLARRGFIKYLYEKLINFDADGDDSIFERVDDQFKLKSKIEFHFVASTTFCGDCSIISQTEDIDENFLIDCEDIDCIGEFGRTGAKNIEGDDDIGEFQSGITANNGLPVRNVQQVGVLRRKPGKGSPSYSMSCSDKMLRWSVLGVQGVLLSSFVPDPIVFESIIIANCKRSRQSVDRAIRQRLNKVRNNLKDVGISLKIPRIEFSDLSLASTSSSSQDTKSSFFTFLWIDTRQETREHIVRGYRQGFTKSVAPTVKKSSISKRSFLESFISLTNRKDTSFDHKSSYLKCKQICASKNSKYSKLESVFFNHFSKWLRTNRNDFYNFIL